MTTLAEIIELLVSFVCCATFVGAGILVAVALGG